MMKNNAINKQLQTIVQLRSEIDHTIQSLNHAQQIVSSLKEILQGTSIVQNNWNLLLETFISYHPNFISNLVKTHTNLTEKEVKVCILLRYGLSTNEISDFFNVSTRNIENFRLRIRKKFLLNKDEKLEVYLNQF